MPGPRSSMKRNLFAQSVPKTPISLRQQIALLNTESQRNSIETSAGDARLKGIDAKVNGLGETKLHIAAKRGNLEKCRMLVLEKRARLDVTDNAGWTPLHEACNRGFDKLVLWLIEHGADVNARSLNGTSPLMDAAVNHHYDVVSVLLKHGADVLLKDNTGHTVLEMKTEPEMLSLLRSHCEVPGASTSSPERVEVMDDSVPGTSAPDGGGSAETMDSGQIEICVKVESCFKETEWIGGDEKEGDEEDSPSKGVQQKRCTVIKSVNMAEVDVTTVAKNAEEPDPDGSIIGLLKSKPKGGTVREEAACTSVERYTMRCSKPKGRKASRIEEKSRTDVGLEVAATSTSSNSAAASSTASMTPQQLILQLPFVGSNDVALRVQELVEKSWVDRLKNPVHKDLPPLPGLKDFKNLSKHYDWHPFVEYDVRRAEMPSVVRAPWDELFKSQEDARVAFRRSVILDRAEMRWSFERRAAQVYHRLCGSLQDVTVQRILRERSIANPSSLFEDPPFRSLLVDPKNNDEVDPFSFRDLIRRMEVKKKELINRHELEAVALYMIQREPWGLWTGGDGCSEEIGKVVYKVNVQDDFDLLPRSFLEGLSSFESEISEMNIPD